MAVTPLSWRVEKYIVSFTVARAGVTLRGGKLTWLRPERLESTRNISSSHSAQAHLFHLGIILFSCFSVLEKDKGDKTFGFSFVSLMRADGTTIPDGGHELCVYKVGIFKAFVIMFLLWLFFISLPGSFNLSCPCVKSGLISQNWGTPPA